MRIVDIDPALVRDIQARDAAADARIPTLASLAAAGRADLVGPGDILAIAIYEVGVALFGSIARDLGQIYDPSARGESFPAIIVDSEGAIRLPYVGRLYVAGHTPAEIETMIERGLRGKSQSPQALVILKQNIQSTVYVAGDVRRPGRFELTLQRERLLDAVALAGGAQFSSEDTVVRFNRGNQTLQERLGRIRAGAADDLILLPGDRIELIKQPRSFIALGATSKITQIPFENGDVSIAEAVARAGGPNDAQANPSAVFLFRYAPPQAANASEAPVIYRLDLMNPTSYFLAQHFPVRDKDVIYFANAAANRPAKMVSIINQLFSPFVAARSVTR